MQNPRVVSELLQLHGKKLRELGTAVKKRAVVLDAVRAGLPARLASHVMSAGLEDGRLTVGVTAGVWASRLRYMTAELRGAVASVLRTEVRSVRIRVVPTVRR